MVQPVSTIALPIIEPLASNAISSRMHCTLLVIMPRCSICTIMPSFGSVMSIVMKRPNRPCAMR